METAIDAGASAPANETSAPSPQPVTIVEDTRTDDDKWDAALQETWDKLEAADKESQRPRDPVSKRFVKPAATDGNTEQSPEPSEAASEGEAPEGEAKESAETPTTQPAPEPVDGPQTYSAEMKDKFSKLPAEFRDLQEYVAKRDGQQNEAIVRLQEHGRQQEQYIRAFDPLSQTLLAYKEDFARRGVNAPQAVAYLLATQRALEQQPFNTWVQIGRNVGIDLGQIFQAAGIDPRSVNIQPQQPNHEAATLQAELRQLKDEIAESKTWRQQQEATTQQWELSQAAKTITDFSQGKPYFDELRPDMAKVLHAGLADDIPGAYKKACAMNEAVAARIQEDQRKEAETKRKAEVEAKKIEDQKKAEQARKDSAVNVKSVPAKATPKTIDDELRAGVERLYG